MSITIDSEVYTGNNYTRDSITYVGPNKSATKKDDLRLAAAAAKATASFSGVGRSEATLTRTLALTGAVTPLGDSLIKMSISVPVGAADADVEELCDDAAAFLSSATGKSLAKALKIAY
jgi:hypothetical protein